MNPPIRTTGRFSTAPDIVLFGTHCRFTATVLQRLIEEGNSVRLVILPDLSDSGVRIIHHPTNKPRLPMLAADPSPRVLPTVTSLCYAHGIMMVETRAADLPSLPTRFAALNTSLSIGVCFPRKLPVALLRELPRPPLNLHPSLLPRHRGPEPLFWTFHGGDRESGVTIHAMDAGFDTGPVLHQGRVPLPPGISWEKLDLDLIDLAAARLVPLTADYWNGELIGEPQPQLDPPWARIPRTTDLVIGSDWSAERAFRFASGVGARFGPLQVLQPDGSLIEVRGATGFSVDRGALAANHEILVQFADGWVSFAR